MNLRRSAALVLAAVVVHCGPLPPDVGDPAHSPIVGGELEDGYPLVGLMGIETGERRVSPFCTGTAVSPTVVLTAGHCISRIVEFGDQPIVVVFIHGEDDATFHHVDRDRLRSHEDFVSGQDPPNVNDVGLVALDEPLTYPLYPELMRDPLTQLDVGTEVTVVGFGATATGRNDLGTKRSILMEIDEVPADSPEYFVVAVPGDPSLGTCNGDSGGPGLIAGDIRDVQVGVHARAHIAEGEDWLCGEGEQTTISTFYSSFIEPAVLDLDPDAADCGDLMCTGIETAESCPADCDFSTCGDHVVDELEVCDDGNTTSGDGCSEDCRSDETCGNSVHDRPAGETCDDGNTTDGDGCSASCRSDETCGNGVLDRSVGEVCDDGNTSSGDGCSEDCAIAEGCGDGTVDDDVGEVCDDGNTTDGDGCSENCRSDETCGNGVVDDGLGEACDDGNRADGDGCAADCGAVETCGDGEVQEALGEACDDGNTTDGDGCSATCSVEEPGGDDGCGCDAASINPARSLARLAVF